MKYLFICCLIPMVACLCLPAVFAQQLSDFEGKPKFEQGEALGYFVWKEGDTWKVRWTTFGKMRNFKGRVTAEGGDIKSLKRIDVESERRIINPGYEPQVVVGRRGGVRVIGGRSPVVVERTQDKIEKESDRMIRFTALTDDDIDGFDFKVAKETRELKFSLLLDGVAQVNIIKIGPDARIPSSNPFVVVLK
jgi:hypothetical protein